MPTDHKTRKESYTRRSADFVFRFQNVSCGVVLLDCCICTRREMCMENLSVCVCVPWCVRAYVCKGCCNLNDIGEGAVGLRNYGVT